MHIACISDIHSNLAALTATLQDIQSRNIDQIYSLGDCLGYHTSPNEVLDILQTQGIISILGNHDQDIAFGDFSQNTPDNFIKAWTQKTLQKKNLEYLQRLPLTLELNLAGKTIQLVHGSPNSITEYLHKDSVSAQQAIENFSGDILVCAHTHIPYIRAYKDKLLINTGSVGKPKIGRPVATYIVLELTDNVKAEIIECPYDYEKTIAGLTEHNFPKKLAEELRLGGTNSK